jgi:hypothetical protein
VFLTAAFVLWIASLPIVVVGIGFSGGEILNPLALFRDALEGDTYFLNRLYAFAWVLTPVVALGLYLRGRFQEQKAKENT